MSNLSVAAVNRSNAPAPIAAVDPEYEQLRAVYTLFLPLMRCAPLFYLGLVPEDIDLVYSKKALINLLTELSQCFEIGFHNTTLITDYDMMNYSKLVAAVACRGQIEFQNFLSEKNRERESGTAATAAAVENMAGGQRGGAAHRSRISISEMLNNQFQAKSQRGGGGEDGPNATTAPSSNTRLATTSGPKGSQSASELAVTEALAKAVRSPAQASKALELALPGVGAGVLESYKVAATGVTESTAKGIETLMIEQDALIRIMAACGLTGDLYSALTNPGDRENKKKRQAYIIELIQRGRAEFLSKSQPSMTFTNSRGAESVVAFSTIMEQIRDIDPELVDRLKDEEGTDLNIITLAEFRTYDTGGGKYSSSAPLLVNIGGIMVACAGAYQLFNSINFSIPSPLKSVHEGRWLVYDRGQRTLFVPDGRIPVIRPGVTVYYSGLEIERRARGAESSRTSGATTLTATEQELKNAHVDALGRAIKDNNKELQSPRLSASATTFLIADNKVLQYEMDILEENGLLATQIHPSASLIAERANIANITTGYKTLGRPVTANNTYTEMACRQVVVKSSVASLTSYWDSVTTECTPVTRTIPPPAAEVSPEALTLFNVAERDIRLVDPTTETVCRLGQRYDQMSMQCTDVPSVGTLIFDPVTESLVPSPFLSSFLFGFVPEAHCASPLSMSTRYGVVGTYSLLGSFGAISGAAAATSNPALLGLMPTAVPLATVSAPAVLGAYEMGTQCIPYYFSRMQTGTNVWVGAGSLALVTLALIASVRSIFKYNRVAKRVQNARPALKIVKQRLEESIESFITKIVLDGVTNTYKYIEKTGGREAVLTQLIHIASDTSITSAGSIGSKRVAIIAVYNKWKTEHPTTSEIEFAAFMDTLSAERNNPDGSFKPAFRPDQWGWLQTIFDPRRLLFSREKTLKEWLLDSLMKAILQKIINDVQLTIANAVLGQQRESSEKTRQVVGLLTDRVLAETAQERIATGEKVADSTDSIEHIRAFFALRELQKNQDVIDYLSALVQKTVATNSAEQTSAEGKALAAQLKMIKEMGASVFTRAETMTNAFRTVLFPVGPAAAPTPAPTAAAPAPTGAAGAGVGPLPPRTNNATATPAFRLPPVQPIYRPKTLGFPSSAAPPLTSAAARQFLAANSVVPEGAGVVESKGDSAALPRSNSVPVLSSSALPAATAAASGQANNVLQRLTNASVATASEPGNALARVAGAAGDPVLEGEGGVGGRRRHRSTRNRQLRKTRGRAQLRNRTRKVRRQRSTRSRKH